MDDSKGLIRRLISETGLSIRELAIQIDASEKSIYKWISGQSLPNCKHLLAILMLIDENRKNG